MFEVLTTPSAIRSWWGVSRAMVDLRKGGTWVTAWGEGDDDSDHVTSFQIVELDPPQLFVLGSGKYITAGSTLETNITTEFHVDAHPHGCNLRIVQVLTPHDPFLDDYFDACIVGWQNCFEGIRNYLHNNPGPEVVTEDREPATEPSPEGRSESFDAPSGLQTDRHLTPDEEYLVSGLTKKELKVIDSALLAEASTVGRKISLVVGAAMENLAAKSSGIPDVFFARRVRKLVGEGKLELDGNADQINVGEVRLPGKS